METARFLILLHNMKKISKLICCLEFEALAGALRRTSAHVIKQGLKPDDVALLAELADHLAKTNEIVARISERSLIARKSISKASMN